MSAKESEDNIQTTKIRVVGIGTSAGGLEALQEFFKAVNPQSGLAYVVIQHLSPDYKSLMDELLARYTTMPIKVIENGVKLNVNTVYLIPPRKNLSIKDDKLFLREVDSNKGLNLPIDIFFRSLADEKGKDAIAIVLSGTGSDGTAGVKAIKERNGMIMAQDENSAKFAGMPSSAVATGFVDYVLRPDEMPEQIISYIQHPLINKSVKKQDAIDDDLDALTKAILIIKEKFKVDFGSYKESTLLRRLERRVSINKFNNLDLYVNFLDSSENEKDILFRELLIGVTQFFRDKEAFNSLEVNVIRQIVTSGKKSIRIWSAGCSTGEEVYSIAIAFKELCTKLGIDLEIKIFATDIDRRALDIASNGVYPESILLDVDPQLVAKYFKKKDNFYKINEEIRNLIVFASHNLLKDPPFSKLDLLICRNLFIYIKPEVQNRLLVMFYYSLQPSGYLFMGISENLGEMTKAFRVVDSKNKIFEYVPGYKPPILSNISLHENKVLGINTDLYLKRKDKTQFKNEEFFGYLLNEFAPPSIIVDGNNQIVSIINDINPFSEIQNGVYSNELFSILPKDIALFINNILRELKKEGKFIVNRVLTGIQKRRSQSINITGRKIVMPVNTYYMFSFEFIEVIKNKAKGKKLITDVSFEKDERIVELEKDLKGTKENLNAVIEELESSNEELQSSNEELVASNEELQSVNEELQSVNEELYTVNAELQSKIDELTRLNDDINNLLRNTQVAALYLDSRLFIRKITPELSKITNVIESDLGRPISHITVLNNYTHILADINYVLETLKPIDKEISDGGKKTFLMRIRPYRTDFGSIDGVIITFTDVSMVKKLETQLNHYSQRLKEALLIGRMSWFEYDLVSEELIFDDLAGYILGCEQEDLPSKFKQFCLMVHHEDCESTKKAVVEFAEGKKNYLEIDFRFLRKDLSTFINLHIKGKIVERNKDNKATKLLITFSDVSELNYFKTNLQLKQDMINIALENTPAAFVMLSSEGNITYANKASEELFGISREQITERGFADTKWQSLGLDYLPIPNEKQPFTILKMTKKPINGYQHFVKHPNRGNILLTIDGTPILSNQDEFLGAVFIIYEVDNGK